MTSTFGFNPGCKKRNYKTRAKARGVRDIMKHRLGVKLYIYKCQSPHHGYHLTKMKLGRHKKKT